MKKIIGILLGMLGGAVVGVVIALANFNVPEYAFSFGNLVLVLLSFVLFFLLAVVVHETGHLVCGLATGYKFSQFRLFSFVWTKKNGKIRFAYSKSFVAGQCLMEPPKDYVDFKYKLYNLGGGLFNIAFGLILLGIWLLLPGVGFLLVGAVLNIVLGLLNLIPLNLEVPNDGMNIRTAAKSDIASQGFHLMLKVSHEMTEGKRFRDFVPELFALPNGADLGNYFVAYFVMLEAARLEDLGEYDAMAGQLRRLKDVKLPAY
ncbi:MAG: hypothetical protein FWC93_08550, partial [Defluviitaleaceae bacterium]|nr:hypothetical protein [Defluviitaleaceae bacterium]